MTIRSRLSLPVALKKAIAQTGKSVNGIATESGVNQAVLQRFVTGKRGITLDTAERLCSYLKLELSAIAET